jgi:nocardicin N-oxygenase
VSTAHRKLTFRPPIGVSFAPLKWTLMTEELKISPPDYPFGREQTLELEPEFVELRQRCPVSRVRLPVGGEAWLATSYEAVKKVLADPAFSRQAATRPDAPRLSPELLPSRSIMALDPPEHTRLRRLIARAFTARRAEALRPRIRQIADELLGRMESAGAPADVAHHLALPLPLITVCELLGVPIGDRDEFSSFSDALTSRELTTEQIAAARRRFEDYLLTLVESRRGEPGDDLLSAMLKAQDEGDHLSDDELVNIMVALLVGGRGSPAVFLTSAIYLLLRAPAQLALLRNDHSLIPNAVEELLRFIPIGVAGGFVRVATRDVELGGVTIAAGEAVLPAMISANRDAAVFEEPDELDVTRKLNPHLGFGHGAHHCIGAPLARVLATTALEALLTRFPNLRLAADTDAPAWRQGKVVRSLTSLNVAW